MSGIVVNKDPRGHEALAEVDARITEFTDRIGEAYRAQAIEELQGSPLTWQLLGELKDKGEALLPPMHSLCLAAGRKDKLRPGDILGALTGDAGIPGDKVGKIAIFDYQAYVAVERSVAKQALQRLQSGKIKGRAVKVRMLQGESGGCVTFWWWKTARWC